MKSTSPDEEQISTDEFTYDAFVSYRRKDGLEVAKWLRKRLQAYRLPTKLVGDLASTARGRDSRPLKIFRDEDYEGADEDFWNLHIVPNLQRARHLIVISTPAAFEPRSDGAPNWLSREIAYFLELRGQNARRRLIVVLGPGAPEDHFPGPLDEMLPGTQMDRPRWNWADFRSYSKKRIISWRVRLTLGDQFAKIAATLFDVPSELVPVLRREGVRRLITLLVVALIGMVAVVSVVSTLGIVAWNQRNDLRDMLASSYWNEARQRVEDPSAYIHLTAKARDVAKNRKLTERIGLDQASRYPAFNLIEILDENIKLKPREAPDSTMRIFELTGAFQGSYIKNAARTIRVVSGSNQPTVLREDRGGVTRLELPHPKVLDVELLRNDTRILTYSREEIKLWDSATGALIGQPIQILSKKRPIIAGSRVITWSQKEITIWDADNGRKLGSVPSEDVEEIDVCEDGSQALTIDKGKARVFDTSTLKPMGVTITVDSDSSLTLLCTSGHILEIQEEGEGEIQIHDIRSGKSVGPFPADDFELQPNKAMLLTWSGNIVRLTSMVSNSARPILLKHDKGLEYAKFVSEGTHVLTLAGGIARLWDAKTGDLVKSAINGTHVEGAEINAAGEIVVTWTKAGILQQWDAATGRQMGKPMHHGKEFEELAFISNGKVLASMDDQEVTFWEAETGDLIAKEIPHSPHREALDEDEDEIWVGNPTPLINDTGDRFVTWTERGNALLYAFDSRSEDESPEHLANLGSPSSYTGEVEGAVFDPLQVRLVTWTADGVVAVWDPQSGKPIGVPLLHNGFVSWADFTKDGRYLLTQDETYAIRVWRQSENHPIQLPIRITNNDQFTVPIFLPELNQIIALDERSHVKWWDAQSGATIRDLPFKARGMMICCSNQLLVYGDNFFMPVDPKTGQTGQKVQMQDKIEGVAVTSRGSVVGTWNSAGSIRFWQTSSGQNIGAILENGGPVGFGSLDEQASKFVATNGETLSIWNVGGGKPKRISIGERPEDVVFHQSGRRIFVRLRQMVVVLDAATGKVLGDPIEHEGWNILGAAFDSDANRVLSWASDSNGTARLWDAKSGQQIGPTIAHDAYSVWGAQFNKVENKIMSWSAGKDLRIWDTLTEQQIVSPMMHDYQVDGAVFTTDEHGVLTWGDDTIRLWDTVSGQTIGAPVGHAGVQGVLPLSNSSQFISYSADSFRIWNLGTKSYAKSEEAYLETRVITGTKLDRRSGAVRLINPRPWHKFHLHYCSAQPTLESVCGALPRN